MNYSCKGNDDIWFTRQFTNWLPVIGNGKMSYVTDPEQRKALTSTFWAITFTHNWLYVKELRRNDALWWSIRRKMTYPVSDSTFNWTMHQMNYLINHGESEFAKQVNN